MFLALLPPSIPEERKVEKSTSGDLIDLIRQIIGRPFSLSLSPSLSLSLSLSLFFYFVLPAPTGLLIIDE